MNFGDIDSCTLRKRDTAIDQPLLREIEGDQRAIYIIKEEYTNRNSH